MIPPRHSPKHVQLVDKVARDDAARTPRRPRRTAAQQHCVNEPYPTAPHGHRRTPGVQSAGVPAAGARGSLRPWLDMQRNTSGDAVFLINPGLPVAGGTRMRPGFPPAEDR